MTPQGKTRLKVWLVLAVVFLLGATTGVSLSGVYFFQHRGFPGGRGPHLEDNLQHQLNLSDEQASAVHLILDETRNDYRSLREQVRPRFDAIRQQERARIRALLSPDQQQRFDQMTARQDAMHDERERKMQHEQNAH